MTSPIDAPSQKMSGDVAEELAQYHAVSRTAVAALSLGLFSPLAFVGPVLWIVPALGAAAGLFAIWSINNSDGALIGRKAAIVGLALALFFFTASASRRVAHRWQLAREARPVAEQWFELLAQGSPELAYQWTIRPAARQAASDDPWTYYNDTPDAAEALRQFVADPLVHALLALGDQADVQYWATEVVGRDQQGSHVSQVYAVTYDENAGRTTIFVRLVLQRTTDGDWQVSRYKGGVRPFESEK